MDKAGEVSTSLTIEALKEAVKTLEETKLSQLVTIGELKGQLAQQKEDQADIYYFLNKKCDESFEIITTLEEQLLNEQADREISEKLYETKIEELRTSASTMETRLQSRVTELEGKLEMLNSFAETKDETEHLMKDLMTKLDEERAQFRINADTMENRFLLEREKLRKSYDIKYESLKKDLESSIDGKLSKKTQRTQIMNVIMKKELDTQSRHAERLLEINELLTDKEKATARELEIARGMEHETLLKLHAANRKAKAQDDQLSKALQDLQATQQAHAAELEEKNSAIAQLSTHAQRAADQLQKSFHETDELWQFLKNSFRHFAHHQQDSVDGELDGKDPHERLLIRLLREVALKYPDYIARYVKVGLDIKDRAKAGIYNWDKDKAQQKSNNTCAHKEVQTDSDDLLAVDVGGAGSMSSRSAWLHTAYEGSGAQYSLSVGAAPAARPGRLAADHHLDDSSSIGAYSVPSLIGKAPRHAAFLGHAQTASEVVDGDTDVTVKSANYAYAMLATPPSSSNKAVVRRSKHRRPLVHPLDVALTAKSLPVKDHREREREVDMRKVLYESRQSKQLQGQYPLDSASLDSNAHHSHNLHSQQLPDISVAGRKFMSPILLPRII